jgi:hypothetical protein
VSTQYLTLHRRVEVQNTDGMIADSAAESWSWGLVGGGS